MFPDSQSGISLGISGDRFTLNGQPTFLLGVSYFDARSHHKSDLNNLAKKGFNLIRIWLDWRDNPFFNTDGNWRRGAEQDLIDLIDFANSLGLVVDVTILDGNMSFGDSQSKRRQAVLNVTEALKGKTNVLFDLVNEHDSTNDNKIPVSHSELNELRDLVKSIDSDRIVTVSSGTNHILSGNDNLQENNVDEEVSIAQVDVLTPHLTRDSDWSMMTGHRVRKIKDYLSTIGRNIPVYLQEEARRGHSGLDPSKEEFLTAAVQARNAGAAGWVFHTDAGFNLAERSFFEGLDSIERAVVDELPCHIFGGSICDGS